LAADRPAAAGGGWRVEALSRRHARDGFSCGSEPLDRYLRQQARQDADKRVAAPFVLVEPPDAEVLGYYTLSASVVEVSEVAAGLAKKLPRYPHLPVTLIGRLAVHQRLKGQGGGAFLLMDALHRSLSHSAQIAAMAVVVDAKDDIAAAFYRHFDFQTLKRDPRRMYLPMKDVAALLA
jgi:predicted GNAT family N-acyltransferase